MGCRCIPLGDAAKRAESDMDDESTEDRADGTDRVGHVIFLPKDDEEAWAVLRGWLEEFEASHAEISSRPSDDEDQARSRINVVDAPSRASRATS
jgi:hypothetical protein